MPNAIFFYRISRWFYVHHMKLLSSLFRLLIFLLYNSRIPGDVKIGKGTYCVCKGIATSLVSGTEIGDNCVLGLRFTAVRLFPFKKTPVLKNNVWTGPNVIVTGPIIIEDDVIIAGGAFVNKSVPKGAIVAGAPAKIIGWRKDLKYNIEENPKYDESTAPYLSIDK